MQRGCVILPTAEISIELPAPESEVLPGVRWGQIEGFPTPAYWAYQVLAQRMAACPIRYKLGATLREELGACLLGGHGVPGPVGVAAFEHLKRRGAFGTSVPTESDLARWLSEPVPVQGRSVRYRFAAQKARYLAHGLRTIDSAPTQCSNRALRDWLRSIPGVGYKTASWIVRNWLDADDVAILDIHILRAGVLGGFLDPTLQVVRHYAQLEDQFIAFSRALGVRTAELDAVIWAEMSQSRRSVEFLLHQLPEGPFKVRHAPLRARAHPRQPRPH
jgi:N-glycosylase/DNA lyase